MHGSRLAPGGMWQAQLLVSVLMGEWVGVVGVEILVARALRPPPLVLPAAVVGLVPPLRGRARPPLFLVSNQVGRPAELKHIIKRRKRN